MRTPIQAPSIDRWLVADVPTRAGVYPSVEACVKLTGDNCPRTYCETVTKQQWKNNNHQTCTAVKQNAGTANPGCYASGPCYEG